VGPELSVKSVWLIVRRQVWPIDGIEKNKVKLIRRRLDNIGDLLL
jgi:hypothetical protein